MLNTCKKEIITVVEQENRLKFAAIRGVSWIKPIHLRTVGQRTAIAVFRLDSQEAANQVIEKGLFVEGKKVWGRKQVQEPRRCLKCQCFREHKATDCQSIHDVCGRCSSHHRTGLCDEHDRDMLACSNCKAANNNEHIGHGMVDRRCLIFLLRLQKMNNTRSKNKYKYFCTSDPKNWETNEASDQDRLGAKNSTARRDPCEIEKERERERRRGRLGSYKRGGGGGTQQIPDKGWEGMKLGMRMEGNKLNSNIQIEGHNHGNVTSIENGSRDKEIVKAWQSGGNEIQTGSPERIRRSTEDVKQVLDRKGEGYATFVRRDGRAG